MNKTAEWKLYLLAALLFLAAAAIDLASDRELDLGNGLQLVAAALFVICALQARRRA